MWYVKWSACSEGKSLASRVVGDAWASFPHLSADGPLPKSVFQTISIITEVSDDASEIAQQLQQLQFQIIERACSEINKFYFLSIITCKKILFYNVWWIRIAYFLYHKYLPLFKLLIEYIYNNKIYYSI